MSSVPMNDVPGHFVNSDKEMCFPSYNFYLKKGMGVPTQFKTRL
jgi:hypothetical protein